LMHIRTNEQAIHDKVDRPEVHGSSEFIQCHFVRKRFAVWSEITSVHMCSWCSCHVNHCMNRDKRFDLSLDIHGCLSRPFAFEAAISVMSYWSTWWDSLEDSSLLWQVSVCRSKKQQYLPLSKST
jgi:hypothetical protein